MRTCLNLYVQSEIITIRLLVCLRARVVHVQMLSCAMATFHDIALSFVLVVYFRKKVCCVVSGELDEIPQVVAEQGIDYVSSFVRLPTFDMHLGSFVSVSSPSSSQAWISGVCLMTACHLSPKIKWMSYSPVWHLDLWT